MASLTALVFEINPLAESLGKIFFSFNMIIAKLKDQNGIDQTFWVKLPSNKNKEIISHLSSKIESLLKNDLEDETYIA